MKPPVWISFALSVGLLLLAGSAYAAEARMIGPNTPKAAQTIKLLRQAEAADRGNSTAWTDDNPGLDHYYFAKAKECNRLLRVLEGGHAVSAKEVKDALNNEGAADY